MPGFERFHHGHDGQVRCRIFRRNHLIGYGSLWDLLVAVATNYWLFGLKFPKMLSLTKARSFAKLGSHCLTSFGEYDTLFEKVDGRTLDD